MLFKNNFNTVKSLTALFSVKYYCTKCIVGSHNPGEHCLETWIDVTPQVVLPPQDSCTNVNIVIMFFRVKSALTTAAPSRGSREIGRCASSERYVHADNICYPESRPISARKNFALNASDASHLSKKTMSAT